MKKIYLRRFLEFMGFFVLCFILLIFSSKLFMPKWITIKDNYQKYIVDSFYKEKKNSLDVVFVGNSDLYHAISPMELWNDYGIVSYNYSQPGTKIWTDYYNLRKVLERQTPKYIFFSTDDFFANYIGKNGNISKEMMSMRWSRVKIEALLNKDVQPSLKIRSSYAFPIIRFHSRYNELNRDDFVYSFKSAYMPTKGWVYATGVKPLKNKDYMSKSKKVEKIPPKIEKYIDKIVDLCNSKNIKLVLFEPPSADSWNHNRHNEVERYAKKKNLDFIDLNYYIDEMGIDWDTDTKDGGDHLNVSGALKTTKFFGEYITNKYKIENHKNDKKYNSWHEEYNSYLKIRNNAIEKVQYNKNKIR